MLVLSRKVGERIQIGDNIEMTIVSIRGDRVRLGFAAPDSVVIHRSEVQHRIQHGGQRRIEHPAVSGGKDSRPGSKTSTTNSGVPLVCS